MKYTALVYFTLPPCTKRRIEADALPRETRFLAHESDFTIAPVEIVDINSVIAVHR